MTPTRYPLQWPAGWKRTRWGDRKDANFKRFNKRLTVADGLGRVVDELGRLGVHSDFVIVSTNVETRLDGMPRSGLAEPADPGVCVYWQHGGVRSGNPMRCMAVDRYTKVADNLAAVAATLEAMRAIERHGGASILDRAFTGFAALPPPIVAGMKRHWRDVLGFPPDAEISVSELRARWKKLAIANHPDRGGDGQRMADINAARDEALKDLEGPRNG